MEKGGCFDEWNAVGNPGVMTGLRHQLSSSHWYLDKWGASTKKYANDGIFLLLDQQGERRMEDVGELISQKIRSIRAVS